MIYSREWEEIDFSNDRLIVPGGWLIRSCNHSAVSIIFFPDPDYTWKLEDEAE